MKIVSEITFYKSCGAEFNRQLSGFLVREADDQICFQPFYKSDLKYMKSINFEELTITSFFFKSKISLRPSDIYISKGKMYWD